MSTNFNSGANDPLAVNVPFELEAIVGGTFVPVAKLYFGALGSVGVPVSSGDPLPVTGAFTISSGTVVVDGGVAHDAPITGNAVTIAARASTATPTAVSNDGDACRLWSSRNGALIVNLRDANNNALANFETTDQDAESVKSTASVLPTEGYVRVFNGASWDRLRGDTVGLFTKIVTALPAGTNVIGAVTTNQATHGTTDKVAADLYVGGAPATMANPVPTTAITPFVVAVSITRPANTTSYSAGQIVNANGASTLPVWDLSPYTTAAAKLVVVTGVSMMGSTNDTTKLQCSIVTYNASTLTGQTLTDQTAFAPTHAQTLAKKTGCLESVTTLQPIGSVEWCMAMTEIQREITTDSAGKIYFAPIALNTASALSAEVYTFIIEGYVP